MYSVVEIGILNAITAGVLALVVLLISRWLRRPAVIHALWVLVLLKLVTPPIVGIPVGLRLERLASLAEANDRARDDSVWPNMRTTPVIVYSNSVDPQGPAAVIRDQRRAASEPATIESKPTDFVASVLPSATLRRWIAISVPVLLWVWTGGTVAWFAIQSWRIAFFMRLTSTAQLASEEIQKQAERLALMMGARRAPRIWILNATMSPFLWAVGWRARVIFPADLLDRVDEEARATLLTHELAHYHRGDHWVRLLEFIMTGLFWWHPVVWVARREIEVAEEHCCDAWVVGQFPGQPRRYAEALLDTIDFLSGDRPRVAPVASGLGQVPFLRERIRLIMSGVAPKSMSGTTRLAVLATAAVLLPLGPQLFEEGIRRADAALETLDLHALTDMTLSKLPEETDASGALATRNVSAAAGAAQRAVDRLEDEPIGISTAEVAAWAIVNSPDGRFQAVANTNGGLVLRDTLHRHSFDLSKYQISSIAFAPHRDLLAAGCVNSTIYLFDCASGEPVATLTGHKAAVSSVAVSLDGRYVVSGSRDGAVKLWDIEYEREVPSRVPIQSSAINCVRFSPDGRLLAIASGDWLTSDTGTVVLWDLRGGTTKQQFGAPSPVGAIAFGIDQLITAEWNGRTTTWDLRSGNADGSATIDKDTVSAACFAADAQSMLLAAANGEQPKVTTAAWFQRMDRDRDGQLAWIEFQGPRSTFRKLDADADEVITLDEVNAL